MSDNIPMVAANIDKWIARGSAVVQSIFGMNNQGGTLYIQLHQIRPNTDGHITAGAIPVVKSFQVLGNLPFAFSNINLTLPGLFVAISTTEANYTAVAAAGGLDMTVVCSSQFYCDGTEHVVGDTGTTGDTFQIWAQAAGPKELLGLEYTNASGEARWLFLYAQDAPAEGSYPILSYLIPNDVGAEFTYQSFGADGLSPFYQSPAYVAFRGCTVKISTTAKVLTTATTNDSIVVGIYK